MSDVNIQRLNGFPSARLRLRSKECISDSAVVGRKATHHAPGTSTYHTASTFGVSGETTCCAANDSEKVFIKKTGGKTRDQGTITEDVLSLHPLPDEMEDKESDIREPPSGMPVKNAVTKGIYFHASPKKSRFYAVNMRKTVADKKSGISLDKGEVVTRIERPGWQVSSSGKVNCAEETFKDLKVNKSFFSSQSDSSKLSEPFRSIVHKSRSGFTPPHQSKKRIFVTSQVTNPKPPQEKVTKLTIRRKTYFPFLSNSRVAKTQSRQNCYFISFNVTPQKLFCKSNDTVTTAPKLEDEQCVGFPHKCVGYENLINTDNKTKSDESLYKGQEESTQKLKGKNKGKVKSRDSSEMSRDRVLSKRCVDKPSEIGSINEGKVEDASYHGKCRLVGSKLSIRSVPCETHSIQNIFQNSALIFFNADKQSKKINAFGKTATARPKIKLFTRNMIESKKQPSYFDHFIYRQKLPSFSDGSALRSKNCAFTQSSPQLTTVKKRNNDRNMIRNSFTRGIPHFAKTKNRLLPGIARDEACVSKKKHKHKKTRSLKHKAVKNKDKSKLALISADTKKAIRDSPPSAHMKILKRRPRTIICHYRNKVRGDSYPDSCSPSDIESPTNEIRKHIPEVRNSETAIRTVQNTFGKDTSWDCYGNTQESLSSYFRQISSCDGSTRKDHMTMLCGTFRLPAKVLSHKKHKFGLYHKQDLRNHAKMCNPITIRHPSIQQSRSSCCTLPFMLDFLNSINTTISAPLFTRTPPENDFAFPRNNRQIQPIRSKIRRVPITKDGKLRGIKGSISKKGSKHFKSQTNVEQTCADEELEWLTEKVIAGDTDTVDILTELSKTRQVNDTGSDLTMCLISKRDEATQKLTTKNNRICSVVSSPNAVKSILDLGPVSGNSAMETKETQQCVRNKSFKPPYKVSTLQEKYHSHQREESRIRLMGPAPAGKERRNCKWFILFLCLILIIQVMLYFRNELYYLIH
ncbi:hypothetical protein BsWGS_17166 [Bradybaena similaris]